MRDSIVKHIFKKWRSLSMSYMPLKKYVLSSFRKRTLIQIQKIWIEYFKVNSRPSPAELKDLGGTVHLPAWDVWDVNEFQTCTPKRIIIQTSIFWAVAALNKITFFSSLAVRLLDVWVSFYVKILSKNTHSTQKKKVVFPLVQCT